MFPKNHGCKAWRMGRAHAWVLDAGQQAWCERREASSDFSVWMIARQRGKSFAALFDDLMFGTRTPGAICRYLGQTGDSALAILGPTMDQIMADVTGLGVSAGEEAVLLGKMGAEEISATDLATLGGTIAWDVFTGIGQRVTRLYRSGDSSISQLANPA